MLIMNVIYQHLTDRKDEEIYFDVVQMSVDQKRTEESIKLLIQNKRALVPKTNVWEKEEGATVAASHLPSLSGQSHQAGPAAFYNDVPTVGKSHKLPKMSY